MKVRCYRFPGRSWEVFGHGKRVYFSLGYLRESYFAKRGSRWHVSYSVGTFDNKKGEEVTYRTWRCWWFHFTLSTWWPPRPKHRTPRLAKGAA